MFVSWADLVDSTDETACPKRKLSRDQRRKAKAKAAEGSTGMPLETGSSKFGVAENLNGGTGGTGQPMTGSVRTLEVEENLNEKEEGSAGRPNQTGRRAERAPECSDNEGLYSVQFMALREVDELAMSWRHFRLIVQAFASFRMLPRLAKIGM